MRTYDRAAVTLDTISALPLGNVYRNASLLESSGAVGAGTVDVVNERGYGELVALVSVNGLEDAVYVLNESALSVSLVSYGVICGVSPVSGDLDLLEVFHTAVDSGIVHVYDSLTLLEVGLLRGSLHEFLSFLSGNDVGDLEECGLKYGVYTAAQTDFLTDLNSVDGVEVDLSLGEDSLHLAGETLGELFNVPSAVEQERTAFLEVVNDVVLVNV